MVIVSLLLKKKDEICVFFYLPHQWIFDTKLPMDDPSPPGGT